MDCLSILIEKYNVIVYYIIELFFQSTLIETTTHYTNLLLFGGFLQSPIEMTSNDLWEKIFFFPDYSQKARHLNVSIIKTF